MAKATDKKKIEEIRSFHEPFFSYLFLATQNFPLCSECLGCCDKGQEGQPTQGKGDIRVTFPISKDSYAGHISSSHPSQGISQSEGVST